MRDAELTAEQKFKSAFRRSFKGNLWRQYGDALLSVFRRRRGQFGYCIARQNRRPLFSQEEYATEHDAITELWHLMTELERSEAPAA
jgi:hypothetical protein